MFPVFLINIRNIIGLYYKFVLYLAFSQGVSTWFFSSARSAFQTAEPPEAIQIFSNPWCYIYLQSSASRPTAARLFWVFWVFCGYDFSVFRAFRGSWTVLMRNNISHHVFKQKFYWKKVVSWCANCNGRCSKAISALSRAGTHLLPLEGAVFHLPFLL